MRSRRKLLYVTIDPFDHRDGSGALRGHGPNLARVGEAAAGMRSAVEIEELWGGRITPRALEDPELLAIFLSGSYTEWCEKARLPDWSAMLDRLCETIRWTSVPILAVCGSHQLVAAAFGGWRAVGHMAPAGSRPVPISSEADGVMRAPVPRVGEAGAYRYRRTCSDPLFDGLDAASGEPLVFSQWHFDQVLASEMPACAVPLVQPAGMTGAAQSPEIGASLDDGKPPVRRHVTTADELCAVQALRYQALPAGRILYTTQFHPDLPGRDATGRPDQGIALIQRFLTLAAEYWDRDQSGAYAS